MDVAVQRDQTEPVITAGQAREEEVAVAGGEVGQPVVVPASDDEDLRTDEEGRRERPALAGQATHVRDVRPAAGLPHGPSRLQRTFVAVVLIPVGFPHDQQVRPAVAVAAAHLPDQPAVVEATARAVVIRVGPATVLVVEIVDHELSHAGPSCCR